MASPPYRSPASSPPNPAHVALPASRKRPIGASPGVPSAFKRRKPSSFSTTSSSHPLRQTSFPPEESLGRGDRSPSVDSDISAVTGGQSTSASVVGGAKKKGKKKKGDAVSTKSGEKGTGGDATSRAGAADEDGEAEDDEGDLEDDDMVDESAVIDQAAEKKKMAVLLDAFSQDQSDRYDAFRRAKLKKETVRKITNQTLSQSVPPSVVTTINAFTKIFIGTLIERARDVQTQWDTASRTMPTPPSNHEAPENGTIGTAASSQTLTASHESYHEDEETKDGYLGPLLPDHIREAFRRYRQTGIEGGAGISGASVGLGVPGPAVARIREKRMFR